MDIDVEMLTRAIELGASDALRELVEEGKVRKVVEEAIARVMGKGVGEDLALQLSKGIGRFAVGGIVAYTTRCIALSIGECLRDEQ